MPTFNIMNFGAAGNGTSLDTGAIQAAIDACHTAGRGIVVVPAGHTFLTGTLTLKDRVRLHVEGDATILASDRREDYRAEGFPCLIEARGAERIGITGTGVIDGRGRAFVREALPHIYRPSPWRPMLLCFEGCRDVAIRDVAIKDAACWGLHLAGCEDVLIHGITILSDLRMPNCDGIDPDHCRRVRISDCYIEAGDDGIVLKNTPQFAQYGPCEDITVSACTLVSTSSAIKIGTESVDDFRRIVFEGCTIRGSHRGLSIQLRDGGNVEDVAFSNMTVETRRFHADWWGSGEPIYVTAFHRTEGSKLGHIRNVRFSNIRCRGEGGVFIAGSPDSRPEDILLENVTVEVAQQSKYPGGRYDLRPCAGPGVLEHATAGFLFMDASGVTVRGCEVHWGEARPDWFGSALAAHRVEGLKLEEFEGEAAHPDKDKAVVTD